MIERVKSQPSNLHQQDIKTEEDKRSITLVLQKQGEASWPYSIKQTIQKDSTGALKLNDIIIKLKKQNFHDYFDASVSYYHQGKKAYVFGFFLPKTVTQKDLLKQKKYQKTIPFSALEEKKDQIHCRLKFRKKCKTKLELLKEEQQVKYSNDEENKKGSKQKQKTIAQVIQKVALWRKLYTGFLDEKDNNLHYELDNAADQVGVIKKTLDDYLLQIRNGKRYGFNFHRRKNQKIGQLRGFVKEKRTSKK